MNVSELQLRCRRAYDMVIEVETRDRGWNASDATNAERQYNEAKLAYFEATGMECEYEPPIPHYTFRFPTREPSPDRIAELVARGLEVNP